MRDFVVEALATSGLDFHDARRSGALEDGITVVAAEMAKGLEFDAIVVVEPAAIIADGADALDGSNAPEGAGELDGSGSGAGVANGHRVLYVALTRATQRVTIVHAAALPPSLTAGPAGSAGSAA